MPLTPSTEDPPAGLAYDRAGRATPCPSSSSTPASPIAGCGPMAGAHVPARPGPAGPSRLRRVHRPAAARPASAVEDVMDTLAALDIARCHLVGASFGAGVAVELALTPPDLVASLFLSAPGGSLIAEVTPDLRAFFDAERAALAGDDLDAAVEANLVWWVDGPRREARDVDPDDPRPGRPDATAGLRDHGRLGRRRGHGTRPAPARSAARGEVVCTARSATDPIGDVLLALLAAEGVDIAAGWCARTTSRPRRR